MLDGEQIQAIVTQYEKHGWSLRRVLLSATVAGNLPPAFFAEAEIVSADLDALWFSREAANGGEAWELRNLSGAPFALVEVFTADDEEEVREAVRNEMETQMLARASKFVNQKTGD